MKIYKYPDFDEKNLRDYKLTEYKFNIIGFREGNQTFVLKIGEAVALIFDNKKKLKEFRDFIDNTIKFN